MESTATPGTIHASASTHALVQHEPWSEMEALEVKGLGSMRTYMLDPYVYNAAIACRAKDAGVASTSLVHNPGLVKPSPTHGSPRFSAQGSSHGQLQVAQRSARRRSIVSYSPMPPEGMQNASAR